MGGIDSVSFQPLAIIPAIVDRVRSFIQPRQPSAAADPIVGQASSTEAMPMVQDNALSLLVHLKLPEIVQHVEEVRVEEKQQMARLEAAVHAQKNNIEAFSTPDSASSHIDRKV